MGRFFLLILFVSIFFNQAHAKNTPFDGFTGDYRVVKSSCVDLVANSSINPPPGLFNLAEISIAQTEMERSFRVILTGSSRNDLIYGEDRFYSKFSGDGVTFARWTRTIDQFGYLFFDEHTILKNATQFTYVLESKYFSAGGSVEPGNRHWKCEFELSL